jgi:general secretion pathway protein M
MNAVAQALRPRFEGLGARLAAARAGLAARWHGFSGREQGLILIFALVALLVAAYYGIARPLQSAHAAAVRDIATLQALNARLADIEPESGAEAAPARRTGSPLDLATAAAADLDLAVTQSARSGEGARFTLRQVPFDGLIAWIADVEQSSSLRVERIHIERSATPGLVGAEVLFQP